MNDIQNRYMEFRLGDRLFAVGLMTVREVLQKPEVTQVPNMPAHFEGMMNLRGQILGVFDLRKKLLSPQDKGKGAEHPVVIVIEEEGTQVGIVVDEVTRVIHPTDDQMSAPPLRANDAASAYVKSVIKLENALIVTLKMSELLGLAALSKKAA